MGRITVNQIAERRKPVSAKPSKPKDMQIIEALAQMYHVHESTVLSWILEMDLKMVEVKIMEEFL